MFPLEGLAPSQASHWVSLEPSSDLSTYSGAYPAAPLPLTDTDGHRAPEQGPECAQDCGTSRHTASARIYPELWPALPAAGLRAGRVESGTGPPPANLAQKRRRKSDHLGCKMALLWARETLTSVGSADRVAESRVLCADGPLGGQTLPRPEVVGAVAGLE